MIFTFNERRGLPGGSGVKTLPANVGDVGSIPGSGRSLGGGNCNPLQYSCLEKSHGQRNLVGYIVYVGTKESDTTEMSNSEMIHSLVSSWKQGSLRNSAPNFSLWSWTHCQICVLVAPTIKKKKRETHSHCWYVTGKMGRQTVLSCMAGVRIKWDGAVKASIQHNAWRVQVFDAWDLLFLIILKSLLSRLLLLLGCKD